MQITILARKPDDKLLLLASDGLLHSLTCLVMPGADHHSGTQA